VPARWGRRSSNGCSAARCSTTRRSDAHSDAHHEANLKHAVMGRGRGAGVSLRRR
jgi:hypothetical protein